VIPDPRPAYEIRRAELDPLDGLTSRLREISLKDPYVVAVADVYNLLNLPRFGEIIGVGYNDAYLGLLEWTKQISIKVRAEFPDVFCSDLCSDNIILAGNDAPAVFNALCALIRHTTKQLEGADSTRLMPLGLFRAGMAWHQNDRGEVFAHSTPGLLAHTLGDARTLVAGTIAISDVVYQHLSPATQAEFVLSATVDKKHEIQGAVWERKWSAARDMEPLYNQRRDSA
jgi:hypothetical protein